MYAPSKAGAEPEYGVWSSIEEVNNIEDLHKYSVDFDENRIQWGVDGTVVRTLTKGMVLQLANTRLMVY